MLIKIGSFEVEASRDSFFIGVNFGSRWRYETYRDLSGKGLSASNWIDRLILVEVPEIEQNLILGVPSVTKRPGPLRR